jgi:hypothetical protein
MSYTAVAYGTPQGFEDIFAGTLSGRDPADLAVFNDWLAPHHSKYVYRDIAGLLSPTGDSRIPPSIWVVQRIAVRGHVNAESEELIFVGLYRHAYETSGQRLGFYGAGYWFNRHRVQLSGAYIVRNILENANAVAEHCDKPLFSRPDAPFISRVFQSTLHQRGAMLRGKLANTLPPTGDEISEIGIAPKSSFSTGSTAFYYQPQTDAIIDPDSFANRVAVEQFVDATVCNPALLSFETLLLTTDQRLVRRIHDPGSVHLVPPALRNIDVQMWREPTVENSADRPWTTPSDFAPTHPTELSTESFPKRDAAVAGPTAPPGQVDNSTLVASSDRSAEYIAEIKHLNSHVDELRKQLRLADQRNFELREALNVAESRLEARIKSRKKKPEQLIDTPAPTVSAANPSVPTPAELTPKPAWQRTLLRWLTARLG